MQGVVECHWFLSWMALKVTNDIALGAFTALVWDCQVVLNIQNAWLFIMSAFFKRLGQTK